MIISLGRDIDDISSFSRVKKQTSVVWDTYVKQRA